MREAEFSYPQLVEKAARMLLSALRKVDADWVRIFPTLDEAIDLLTAVMDRAHNIWEATE